MTFFVRSRIMIIQCFVSIYTLGLFWFVSVSIYRERNSTRSQIWDVHLHFASIHMNIEICLRKLNTSLPPKSEQMHLFTPDPILEEDVFIPRNIDWECETIGQQLFAYGEKFIEPALVDGIYSFAVQRYLQMLDSLTAHFVADEHWTYYDDLYFPNHAVSYIWEQFVPHIRSGKLTGEDLKTLEDGLALIAQTEAYQNYGIPSRSLFKVIISQ